MNYEAKGDGAVMTPGAQAWGAGHQPTARDKGHVSECLEDKVGAGKDPKQRIFKFWKLQEWEPET